LGERAKVKETTGLYSRVWKLPSYRIIVFRMILSVAATSLLAAALRVLRFPSLLLPEVIAYYLVLLGIPVLIGTELLYLAIKKEGSPLDRRRTTGTVQFGIIFWLSLGLVGSMLDLITGSSWFEPRLWMFGSGVAYLLFAFLVTSLSDYPDWRNFAAALIPTTIWLCLSLLLSIVTDAVPQPPQSWLLALPVALVLFTIVVMHLFRSVSRPFERDLGISGPKLLRAFGHAYLVDNPEPFEDILTSIGTAQEVPMQVVLFKSEKKLHAVGIVLYVHPGPFRNIGSSHLPSVIIQHVKSKHGVPAFVMHGTCTHHQNLTSKAEYPKVMAEIDRLIEETNTQPKLSGPHWTDSGKFKVWTLFVGNNALAITTSAPEFTDDVSMDVGLEAARTAISRVPQLKGVAIVDAHNCIDDDAVSVMSCDPEASQYIDAVSDAIVETNSRAQQEVALGIYYHVPDDITIDDGVGTGGIVAIALQTGSVKSSFVSIDGNNMEPGFREDIIMALRKQGYDQAEVMTTDTHAVNAVALSNKGYPPVGRQRRQEILQHILIASEKAKASLQPVTVGLGFGKLTGITVYGEKGFDVLTEDVTEAAHAAKRVGPSSAGVALLLSLLMTLLL